LETNYLLGGIMGKSKEEWEKYRREQEEKTKEAQRNLGKSMAKIFAARAFTEFLITIFNLNDNDWNNFEKLLKDGRKYAKQKTLPKQ